MRLLGFLSPAGLALLIAVGLDPNRSRPYGTWGVETWVHHHRPFCAWAALGAPIDNPNGHTLDDVRASHSSGPGVSYDLTKGWHGSTLS